MDLSQTNRSSDPCSPPHTTIIKFPDGIIDHPTVVPTLMCDPHWVASQYPMVWNVLTLWPLGPPMATNQQDSWHGFPGDITTNVVTIDSLPCSITAYMKMTLLHAQLLVQFQSQRSTRAASFTTATDQFQTYAHTDIIIHHRTKIDKLLGANTQCGHCGLLPRTFEIFWIKT